MLEELGISPSFALGDPKPYQLQHAGQTTLLSILSNFQSSKCSIHKVAVFSPGHTYFVCVSEVSCAFQEQYVYPCQRLLGFRTQFRSLEDDLSEVF